jgi:hypothetical protein
MNCWSSTEAGRGLWLRDWNDKGKGLAPLCDALGRLAVERIKLRPQKYEGLGKGDGLIEDIQILKASTMT